MNSHLSISTDPESKFGELKAILFLLQTNVEKYWEEIDSSYELLKVGQMTDLTKKIDETLSNPLSILTEASNDLDFQVKRIVDFYVKKFFSQNKGYLTTAFRSLTPQNELHYSLVLKEDNIENRNKIFEFLEHYDLMDIANKYPVYFQFVPIEFIGKLRLAEELNLA